MGLGFKIFIATSKTGLSVQYAFRYASSEPLRKAGFIHKLLGMRCYGKWKPPIRGDFELCTRAHARSCLGGGLCLLKWCACPSRESRIYLVTKPANKSSRPAGSGRVVGRKDTSEHRIALALAPLFLCYSTSELMPNVSHHYGGVSEACRLTPLPGPRSLLNWRSSHAAPSSYNDRTV